MDQPVAGVFGQLRCQGAEDTAMLGREVLHRVALFLKHIVLEDPAPGFAALRWQIRLPEFEARE